VNVTTLACLTAQDPLKALRRVVWWTIVQAPWDYYPCGGEFNGNLIWTGWLSSCLQGDNVTFNLSVWS